MKWRMDRVIKNKSNKWEIRYISPNFKVSCNFLEFMGVVESGQDKIVRVKVDLFGIGLFKNDFMSTKDPSDSLLFYFFTVSIDELFKFILVLELEDLQSLRNWKLRICLLGAFGNLESDCLWNSVQKWTEVIQRTIFLQLENSTIVSLIKSKIPSSIASFNNKTYETYLSFKSLYWRVSILA